MFSTLQTGQQQQLLRVQRRNLEGIHRAILEGVLPCKDHSWCAEHPRTDQNRIITPSKGGGGGGDAWGFYLVGWGFVFILLLGFVVFFFLKKRRYIICNGGKSQNNSKYLINYCPVTSGPDWEASFCAFAVFKQSA